MTKTELTEIGRKVYGPVWKTRLAKELGRSRVTVYYWAKGTYPIPKVAADRIRELASKEAL